MQFLVFTNYTQTKNDERLISITKMFELPWYTMLNNSTNSCWNLTAKLFTTEKFVGYTNRTPQNTHKIIVCI